MQQLSSSQASPEVPINENFETLSHQAVFGLRQPATTGLTWGYWGGRWGGISVADGTLTLTDNATNYVVVNRSSAAISVSATTTNWNDTANYARVYQITTAGGVVTAVQDHRVGPNGVLGQTSGSGSGSTQGRHSIPIMAAAMTPSASGGSAPIAVVATASNQPDIVSLDFDPATQEHAKFSIPMPKKWNEGTVTAKFIWSHASTTTNFGVRWGIQGVAVGDDETIATAYGTAQEVADTGGTTNRLYISPETSAITIAGSPQDEDVVFFRVYRAAAHASDTLAIDARLHAVVLYITTNADTDL